MKTFMFVILSFSLFACKDKGDDTAATDDTAGQDTDTDLDTDLDIEIAGSWLDGYGSDHIVSNTEWSSYGGGSVVHLSQYDNDANFAVGQNDAANEYNPSLFSRYDWFEDTTGQLWYCTTAYDAATEEDAANTAAPSTADPATTGCGSFPWSTLDPA